MTSSPVADRPKRASPDREESEAILALIQRSFDYMEARIDPPSSMHRLTPEAIRQQCLNGELWTIGTPPVACIFLTEQPGALYVGKLAVDETIRGRGIARRLIDLASDRARARGLRKLTLETRIELVENHAAFERLGFEKSGVGAHDGYDTPTFVRMEKSL